MRAAAGRLTFYSRAELMKMPGDSTLLLPIKRQTCALEREVFICLRAWRYMCMYACAEYYVVGRRARGWFGWTL